MPTLPAARLDGSAPFGRFRAFFALSRKFRASFHNACRDNGCRVRYISEMETDLLNRLNLLRPAIKVCWESRLRGDINSHREHGAMINPGMLVLMIDDTLARLSARLGKRSKPRSIPHLPPSRQKMRNGCRCGLHLLLNYYLTGIRALWQVLPRNFGQDRVHICHCFNILAHDEIEALASICRFRNSSICSLKSAGSASPLGDGGA
jgi:hypothetical protein